MATQVLWTETTTGYVRSVILQDVLQVTGYGEQEPPVSGYFVSTSGDDGNDGSLGAPFLTITRGIAAASPGDTVYVREGNYAERVVVNRSGAPGRSITIKAYPGETPIVDGEYNLPEGDYVVEQPDTGLGFVYEGLVELRGDHITWDGIDVTRSRGRGMMVQGNNIIVRNCSVYSTRSGGINCLGSSVPLSNVTVDNVISYDCNNFLVGTSLPAAVWMPCIHMKYLDNGTIRNCTVSGIGEGLAFAAVRTGLIQGNVVYDNVNTGIWAHYSQDVVVERNLVYTSANVTPANGIGTGLDTGVSLTAGYTNQRNTFMNNIVIGRRNGFCYAAYAQTYPPEAGGLKDCVIANNTFLYANMNGKLPPGRANMGLVFIANKSVISGSVFYNNIFLQDTTKAPMLYGTGHSQCTWDYNCWSPSAPSFAGAHKVVGDPLLRNALAALAPGGANPSKYKLTSASPCRDTGTVVAAVTEDYWGTTRPRRAAYDIGAHEYK